MGRGSLVSAASATARAIVSPVSSVDISVKWIDDGENYGNARSNIGFDEIVVNIFIANHYVGTYNACSHRPRKIYQRLDDVVPGK